MKLSSIRSGRPIVTAVLLSSLALAAACGGSESSPIAPSTPGASLPGGGSGGGTSGPTSTPDNLLGQWTLATVVRDGVSETVPKGTGSFNVTFGSDGRVGMRADCNVCTSTYQADAGGILDFSHRGLHARLLHHGALRPAVRRIGGRVHRVAGCRRPPRADVADGGPDVPARVELSRHPTYSNLVTSRAAPARLAPFRAYASTLPGGSAGAVCSPDGVVPEAGQGGSRPECG